MPAARVLASVRKMIVLTLCVLSCCCLVSGCAGSAPKQSASSQGSSSPQPTQITMTSAVTALGEPVSIQANLKDGSGQPLDGKIVEWFIDGAPVGQSQVKNGVTMMNLTGEYVTILGINAHQVGVSFYGDTNYQSSTATSFLQITATGAPEEVVTSNSTVSVNSSVSAT